MIKTAVILAAGFGSRLKEKTKYIPKGFLVVEGDCLVERSVKLLLSHGIEKIYIGTGYLSEVYESFASKYPAITTIKSDRYESTSSMYTLYNMRHQLKTDFLLLESDLLYESKALSTLLNSADNDCILASGKTYSNDEVFIECDADDYLVNMSKNAKDLRSIDGELVGISKISHQRYVDMCILYETINNPKIDYEYIMVASGKSKKFMVKKLDDLIWCEIDNDEHLQRARNKIMSKIKSKEPYQVKRNVLLNPGPATTTDTVKFAQVVPDICPREKEFGDLMAEVSHGLTSLVANPTTHTTVLFACSGTGVVESVITSVIPHDRKVVIINNGAYGKRMCQIAETFNIPYIEFKSSPILPVDLIQLKKILSSDKKISHLAFIHNETTTGLLNNLDALGHLARQYNLKTIVDAMSSYAAIPIDMVQQNVDFLCASSNKNIQGMAGVGFVIASHLNLQALKEIKPRSFYLSLYDQYESFIKTHQMRFTPPVQTLYALRQAVSEAIEETTEKRFARYSQSWKKLTDTLKQMNLEYVVDDQNHSKIITSIKIPTGIDFDHMHDFFYERGFTIYPGKVADLNTFRIANIGAICENDMVNFLSAFQQYIELHKK